MSFQFIHNDWLNHFIELSKKVKNEILIISPFIQLNALKTILPKHKKITDIKTITRFNLSNFYDNVSDIKALLYLMEKGASVKGIRNLHSKVYIFDSKHAIVTSANLTLAALKRNHEYGIMTSNEDEVNELVKYFNELWMNGGSLLTNRKCQDWLKKIDEAYRSRKIPKDKVKLGDYGEDLGLSSSDNSPHLESGHDDLTDNQQYFIKFFGISSDRSSRSNEIITEIERSGCHKVCTYPKSKKPRSVNNGDLIFTARLVEDPNDIIIYGRAIAIKHDPKRDFASESDIRMRSWRSKWPNYIRISEPEFIKGKLENGISMNLLMKKFGHNSFMSTRNNHIKGTGNTNPRKAYMQKAHVQLTQEAASWLNSELNTKLYEVGRLEESRFVNIE